MTSRRITVVASELLGRPGTGGAGTADSLLAVALGRQGHDVDLLIASGRHIGELSAEWTEAYDEAGVAIRVLERLRGVRPAYLAPTLEVFHALREHTPDVAIVNDWRGLGYAALRIRQLGRAFDRTAFIVHCHGAGRVLAEFAQKVPDTLERFGEEVTERASVELADAVVSPSAYLVEWMRQQGWRLPDATHVIPLLTRSSSTGEAPPEPALDGGDRMVERLAFFGRLEERKGVQPFAAGLNALPRELLAGVELEFIGKPTKYWGPEQVASLLSLETKRALRSVTFETGLDQDEALRRVGRPGTLAVMPSLAENSPNVVYECLERRIPFLASATGGIGELVAPEDHGRVLFEPTAEAVAAALGRALTARDSLRPARPAFDGALSLERWGEVVSVPPGEVRVPLVPAADVDLIVAEGSSPAALDRCLAALERQTYDRLRVAVAPHRGSAPAARAEALQRIEAPWVVFLDEEDIAGPDFVETLLRAQAETDADVVSCGLSIERENGFRTEYIFSGEPAGLGLLANDYGTVGLIRRALLEDVSTPWPILGDADWPLLARLAASGARIVSVPIALVTRTARPGGLEDAPSDVLLVLEELEQALPPYLRSLARLAAGLAAEKQRRTQVG
jgi:glycosyltransferase involved in cell wall biosynthesis